MNRFSRLAFALAGLFWGLLAAIYQGWVRPANNLPLVVTAVFVGGLTALASGIAIVWRAHPVTKLVLLTSAAVLLTAVFIALPTTPSWSCVRSNVQVLARPNLACTTTCTRYQPKPCSGWSDCYDKNISCSASGTDQDGRPCQGCCFDCVTVCDTPTPVPPPTATHTPVPTPTDTLTPAPTFTLTPTLTPTSTPTDIPTDTPTPTLTPTHTPTGTLPPTATPTDIPIASPTSTPTWTPAATATQRPAPQPPTATPTIVWYPSRTPTPLCPCAQTATAAARTPAVSPTWTPTPTSTLPPTPTPTATLPPVTPIIVQDATHSGGNGGYSAVLPAWYQAGSLPQGSASRPNWRCLPDETTLFIRVYVDYNGDGFMSPMEGVSNLQVYILGNDYSRLGYAWTLDGQAVFCLAPIQAGRRVYVDIPYLQKFGQIDVPDEPGAYLELWFAGDPPILPLFLP